MKVIKKSTVFFFILIFWGCSTFQYLPRSTSSEKPSDDITEYDLSYQHKVMGIDLSGKKSIVEGYFLHPDGKSEFFLISFPKIGILRTTDRGITFSHQFFTNKSLETHFGFIREDEEEKPGDPEEPGPRLFASFTSGKKNPANLLITYGSFLFYSSDYGNSWKIKNLFFDQEKSFIRKILVNSQDELFLVTGNKIIYSSNWFKSQEFHLPRLSAINAFQMEITDAFLDVKSGRIFFSIRSNDEPHGLLSDRNYEYFYEEKADSLKSGVYYSDDQGRTLKSANIPALCVFFENNDRWNAVPFYPFYFYEHPLPENITASAFYQTGKSVVNDRSIEELILYYQSLPVEAFQFFTKDSSRFLEIDTGNFTVTRHSSGDPEVLIKALQAVEKNHALQWRELPLNRLAGWNFRYEMSPYNLFKVWTGMKTGGPVIYRQAGKSIYRMKPDPVFLKDFLLYSLTEQARLNRINPFLRKKTDREFYDPSRDPTQGFPVTLEISRDQGLNWSSLADSRHIRAIIDPIGNKRSAYYWIKNIEQKRTFKLQLSFGLDQGVSFFNYPEDIQVVDQRLVILMNYFTLSSSYRDLYQLPVKP